MNYLIFFLAFIGISCNNNIKKELPKKYLTKIVGNTQGTTYEIKLYDKNESITKKSIDSILNKFDLELSGYIDNSIVSKINKGILTTLPKNSNYFKPCFNLSKEVYQSTNGAFDPTVFPLVKAWGFFKSNHKIPNQNKIDSILKNVGFNKIFFDKNKIIKKENPILDFNAIAQGYSVDVLSKYIQNEGHNNFYIEIGGEISVYGSKPNKQDWILAIESPNSKSKKTKERVTSKLIQLKGTHHIATSGNYRNFFEVNGKKYGHSIDPNLGKPVMNNIKSASVIANSCAIADAYATALMVLNKNKSIDLVNQNKNIECYLIYEDKNGVLKDTMSSGFSNFFLKN